ncbi:transposase [Pontiella desulfatans]|nr:transposase [Pontiella desulfatans]
MSRVVNGDFVFGDKEKEFFRYSMRKLEHFMGIRILTYCIMSNHFHLLVEIPHAEHIDDDELKNRIMQFYPPRRALEILAEFNEARAYSEQTGNQAWLNKLRNQYLSRMGNLSAFSKELKERFTKWYNRRNARRGTLWEERFKSVLVESSESTLLTMAAYIDLNPVRAGLVDDPRDYRYCGYAESVAGNNEGRAGLMKLLDMHGQGLSWRTAGSSYRKLLFMRGEESESKPGFNKAKVQQVIEEGGELCLQEVLRCRIRYFSDGVAVGSRLFVEDVFERHRDLFGERRKTGARKLPGNCWQGLCSLRNLRLNAITAPG